MRARTEPARGDGLLLRSMREGIIRRGPGPLSLDGFRCESAAALSQLIQSLGLCVVSDLSVGSWRSFQIAEELMGQLGMEVAPSLLATPAIEAAAAVESPTYRASTIDAAIDSECAGNKIALRALVLAHNIVAALRRGPPRNCLVLAPRSSFSCTWAVEDVWFVRFLAQGLQDTECRLYIIATDEAPPALPEDWRIIFSQLDGPRRPLSKAIHPLELVPSVVAPPIVAALVDSHSSLTELGLVLDGGWLLIPPERRRAPSTARRLDYDRLAILVRAVPWLRAYAEVRGNNLHVDPGFLLDAAQQRFAEGNAELALRYLERAGACARHASDRAICQSFAQGIRVAAERYQEAAAVAVPSPALLPQVRAGLLQNIGWGMVMSGEAVAARRYLQEARELLTSARESREYLYLLNISALTELKIGNSAGAMQMEQEIAASLAGRPQPDWHLTYINSINLARLYRRLGDLDSAERHYQRAFSTTLGCRSMSDAVYCNVCFGLLAQAKGQMDRALRCWLQAALHWLRSPAPEAIAHRVAGAIMGRPLLPLEDPVEPVSEALEHRLLGVIRESSFEGRIDNRECEPPVFLLSPATKESKIGELEPLSPSDQQVPIERTAAILGVFLSRAVAVSAASGPAHSRLRILVRAVLSGVCEDEDLLRYPTILVDDRHGKEIPETEREILEACVENGVDTLRIGHRDVTLSAAARDRLVSSLRVRQGAAVASLIGNAESMRVTFKRYLPPRLLTGVAAQLASLLSEPVRLADLVLQRGERPSLYMTQNLVRTLKRARIVDVELPEDVSIY